jgi:alkanesulfonate monooxygenase SsuD/methylene tetrahydromethanopterin reductase-like flavin-dependent oxidoreductase (luciferase family)
VTLGPFVACNSFREPALLAKMADTLDDVSGGRLLLGLGAGWHEPEYRAFGFPYDHLAGRFEEALQIIVPLLKGETVTFHGKYYHVDDALLTPRGPRPAGPPIWIGAKGPRMMRMVARYADAYNTVWHRDPSPAIERYANLEAACREVGRDPAEIMRTSGTNVLVAGAGDAPDAPPHAITGSPHEIAEKLYAFRTEAGVDHLTLVLDPRTVRGIEQFGKVIEALRTFE